MFRKFASVAVILAVLLALLAFGVSRMALTLNIGSGAIALVQNGAGSERVQLGGVGPFPHLPVPSTAGTTLVAVLGHTTPRDPPNGCGPSCRVAQLQNQPRR